MSPCLAHHASCTCSISTWVCSRNGTHHLKEGSTNTWATSKAAVLHTRTSLDGAPPGRQTATKTSYARYHHTHTVPAYLRVCLHSVFCRAGDGSQWRHACMACGVGVAVAYNVGLMPSLQPTARACAAGPATDINGEWRGYDWFKTGPTPNNHISKPDLSVYPALSPPHPSPCTPSLAPATSPPHRVGDD
jgi:hypothetical protein